jgi:PKD repeat protein/pimeloyl-ACP methyl ester carboxylesterase
MRVLFSIIFGTICFSMFGQVVSIAKNETTLISGITSIPNEASASDLIILDSNTRSLLPSSNIHLPYPVIFIHGLNSDFSAWHDQRDALVNGLAGLSFGGYYDYCLNYDGNNSTANKLVYPVAGADIAYFNLANPVAADYYIVNFDIDNFGRLRYNSNFTDVLSNESAIAKQGRALKGIISMVLNLTGRDKVVLMGHSMGGLAAREYIQNPSNWQADGQHHVAKLVTTGTPHGGYEGVNFPCSIFTSNCIDESSEAYRDLKSDYWISGANGVYLFGGYEYYSVMNNNGLSLYDFYNVDVNCNGIDADGLYVTGLNQRSWQNNLDYAYIIGHCTNCLLDGGGPGDGIVRSENANLSNFTNQLLFPYNEFIYEAAGGALGLHSDLPHKVTENMKGLDEPNEYALSYGIDFNVEYTGFISMPSNLGYDFDYDDYVFELPIDASIELTTYSNYFVDLPFRIINAQSVVYSGILSPNSSGSFFTQELSAGTYYLEFYMNENSIYDNSYEYPYKFELDIAPVVRMFTASTNTICVGECISFADNTSNSPNDWNWSFPGANTTVSNSQNPSNICYNTPGAYSVSLTTSNGYSTDNTTMTGYITVLAQPSSIITQNANTMSSSSPTGNQWYLNNTPISGATGQSFSPTTSGIYYVQVTNSNGCSQMSAPFNFIYTPQPIAGIATNFNQVCAGECIEFSDNSSNSPTSWLWTFEGGNPATSNLQDPGVVCYQASGSFNVTLMVTNSGGSDEVIYNNYVVVNVSPSTPGISINGNLLTSSVSNGNQWFLNGNLIAGATSSTYLANQSGSYTVEVTNSMGCNAESNAVNLIVTDVQDRTSLNNLIIHPNPAFNSIRVSNVLGLNSIRIFDSSAKLLLETKNLVIDLSSYSEGVYIIQVDSEGGVTNHRLIKINE